MFEQNQDFYPTPQNLINRMLNDTDFINFREVGSVMEPSAGKGDLVEAIIEKFKSVTYNSYSREDKVYNIDCIELEPDLRHILMGKKMRVIHDDFLTYDGYKKYDVIISNPPFSSGVKHLLKMIEMQKRGGKIICLLNSESILNPYSNERKDLVRKLKTYDAKIEYIENAFDNAERTTNVTVALIKINVPKTNKESVIINNLKKEEQYRKENSPHDNNLINSDFIKGIIEQYNFEIKAGLNLINEYENLKPLTLKTFKNDKYLNEDSILIMETNGSKYDKTNDTLVNSYIKKVRYKYWEALFNSDKFSQLLTSNLMNDYRNKITELQEYDFSWYNIKEIQMQMNKNMIKGVEDTIMALFDELSFQHSYNNEFGKNILYFDGWKSNKCWKISSRVIIPLKAFSEWKGLDYSYNVINKLSDIEKSLSYLNGEITEDINIKEQLAESEKLGLTKNIKFKFFNCNFYKKNTCHITFTDEELIAKFNRFAAMNRNFLPPSYSKVKYKDMTKEDQKIVNDFEGEVEYDKVIKNPELFIYNPSKTLMIQQ